MNLIKTIQSISLLEWIGVFFNILQVLLAWKNKAINYIFGILGACITMYLCYNAQLFAEAGLNLYYVIMSVYGIILWLTKNENNEELPITFTNKIDWFKSLLIFSVALVTLIYILHRYTTSDVVIADALVSAFAWAGMWLMAKRKVENWLILNISNLLAIPLFIHKDMYLYAVLSVILFTVAMISYFDWRKLATKL
jgi:nicotinamide mononucleotide transporter